MGLTQLLKQKSDEDVKKINELLDKWGEISEENRTEARSNLNEATELYKDFLMKNGRDYTLKNCPEIPRKINELGDKLMEYNS